MSVGLWIARQCVRDPRISGGARILLREYNRWLEKAGERDCGMDEFRSLLGGEKLYVIEIAGTLLIPGLGLEEDWRAIWRGAGK